MNLDHDFVQVSKLSENKKKVFHEMEHFFPQIQMKTKKKGLHQKWNTFFPRIQVDTYAQMHTRVKLLGRDADIDHTQTIGGDTVNLLGGYIPPSPRVSAALASGHNHQRSTGNDSIGFHPYSASHP